MKYQDTENTVNGFVVGIRVGSPLKDALAPTDDGYNHLREVQHVGTVLQDAEGEPLTPVEE
jgi:hypothetical protein